MVDTARRYTSAPNIITMLTIMILCVIWSGSVMPGSTSQSKLILINECTCPGFTLTFRCTVLGIAGATVWRGSAIECPESNYELTFFHLIRFMDIRGCNSGAIIGRGVEIEDTCYTSQLNITVDYSMNGKNVECIYNNGTFASVIGNSSVTITSDPFPPPHNVTVVVTDINPPELTFEWNPVSPNCLALHYVISFNCGICPSITTNTTTVCTEIQLGISNCTFTIQTNVCDSLIGDATQIPLVLKVPNVPIIHAIPLYSHLTSQLSSLQVEVYEVERFYVSDGLDGSPINHVITYTNAVSGITCDSASIPVSSCTNNVCRHSFNMSQTAGCQNLLVPAANYGSDLIVSVLSTNVLGNGSSNNITIGFMNTFVEVTFNSDITRAVCKFLIMIQFQQQIIDNRYYYCSITYEPINSDINHSRRRQQRIFGTSQNNTVDLNFPQGSLLPGTYHFTVNATDSLNTTLIIEGTFEKGESKSQFTVNGLVFGGSIGAMGLLILIITVVLTITLIRSQKQASNLITEHPTTGEQNSTCTSIQPEQSFAVIDTERNVAYISSADARQSLQALHT